MIARLDPADAQLSSPLGRSSPVLKLVVAVGWLVGLAFTSEIVPPLLLAAGVLLAARVAGDVPAGVLFRALVPLWSAALGVGLFNLLFNPANLDPAAATVAAIGPWRITEPAIAAGAGLAARVVAIAAVGVAFAQTTDPTRLVDSLVQQAGVAERFAYGALAAYQAIPRFAEDLASLRQARRIRGLSGSWHPRLLVGLLVLAIRHGDRVALAMDARAFGTGPRSRYRLVRWGVADVVVALGGAAVLAALLVAGRLG